MNIPVSSHFTKNAALRSAAKFNDEKRNAGRSSGWAKFDYAVRHVPSKTFKKWEVYVR